MSQSASPRGRKAQPTGAADGGSIMCKMAASRWQPNTMVPTYYVAPKSRKGYFSTLNDAIAFAEPYSRIEVLSGKYFENVVIQKPIEIGCEKGDEAAEFYSHGVTLTIQDDAFIEGMTIRTGDQKMAVLIENEKQIKPKIFRCEIDSIEIGGNAAPTVSDNRIRHGRVHGVHVTGRASGLYVDNVIENHAWYSVVVESDGEPSFVRNKIQGGERGQVLVRGYGAIAGVAPTFTQNRITDVLPKVSKKTVVNARMNDAPIKTVGDRVNLIPTAQGGNYMSRVGMREIHQSDQGDDASCGETEGRCAIEVAIGAAPVIANNTIIGSINHGIVYRSGGAGLFEGNFVMANKGWGAVLEDEETNPTFVKNQFSSNVAGGVRVRGARGSIDGRGGSAKNEFKDNHGPQLLVIRGHRDFVFRDNAVQAGSQPGVVCRDGGSGTFSFNEFNYCSTVAVRIESEANPYFTKNEFKLCNISVLACRAGQGHFVRNEFSMNRNACVVVMSLGNPCFESCTFSTSNCAVVVTKAGRGTFRQCQLKDNRGHQVEISELGNPTFENCTFADGSEDGVRVYDNGRGYFVRNFFCHNIVHMTVQTRSDPICTENVFTRAVTDGLVFKSDSLGLFTANVIERSRNDGVLITSGAFPTIRGNFIYKNRHAGLHVGEGGDGVLEKNEIHSCGVANVCVSASGIPQASMPGPQSREQQQQQQQNNNLALIKRNWIAGSFGHGLLATSHGTACVVENLFRNNASSAIRATTSSVLLIVGNLIDGGGEGIAMIEDARCRVYLNVITGTEGNALMIDSGARPHVSWNIIDGAVTGMLLNSGHGYCFENTIKNCSSSAIILGNLNRTHVGFNTLFRNRRGLVLTSKCRSTVICNTVVESGEAGIRVEGSDVTASVECNTVFNSDSFGIHCVLGSAKFNCNALVGSQTNICIEGEGAGSLFTRCLVVAATVGVAARDGGRGKLDGCLIGHCDRGAVFLTRAQPHIKNTVIHNCSIAGIFADDGGSCEMSDCSLFKNFINVVSCGGAKPYVFRSLLQSPTMFNTYFSSGGCGHVYNCVITSHSKHTDDMIEVISADIRREFDRVEQEKIIAAAGLAPSDAPLLPGTEAYTAAKQREKHAAQQRLRTLPLLWDDHFGSPRSGACQDDAQGRSRRTSSCSGAGGAVATSGARTSVARECLPPLLQPSHQRGGGGRSMPSATRSESHSRRTSAASQASALDPRSPNIDDPLSDLLGGVEENFNVKYRFAVLYPAHAVPSQSGDQPAISGRSFAAAHRVFHSAPVGSGRKGFFQYFCSGVMIDENASPLIEGCVICDHDYKARPIKAQLGMVSSTSSDGMSKRRAAGPEASGCLPQILQPAETLPREEPSSSGSGDAACARPGERGQHQQQRRQRQRQQEEEKEQQAQTRGPFPMRRNTMLFALLREASPAFRSGCEVYGGLDEGLDMSGNYWVAPPAAAPQPSSQKGQLEQPNSSLAKVSSSATLSSAPPLPSSRPASSAAVANVHTHLSGGGPSEAFAGFAIIAANGGEGEIRNCIVEHNLTGIKIERAADLLVTRTVVRAQQGDGIVVTNGGLGTIANCHLHENNLYQISVDGEGTAPTIEANVIHDGRHNGVHIDHRGGGTLRGNKIFNFAGIGVCVGGGAGPAVEANMVYGCSVNVAVKKGARGTFTDNRVLDARTHGVLVEGEGTAPLFLRNFMSQNGEHGAQVMGEGAVPRFEANEFFRNGQSGFHNTSRAAAVLVSNRLYDNSVHGILVTASGKGIFTKNVITGNCGAGISVTSLSTPEVISNVIFDGDGSGIVIQNATGHYEFNRIKNSSEQGVVVEFLNANPTIVRNEIEGGLKCGIVVSNEARGVIKENFIANNAQHGVLVEFAAAPRIERNMMKQNAQSSIWCRQRAVPEVRENLLLMTTRGHGIVSETHAIPAIHRNLIGFHSHHGLLFLNEGKGSCTENVVTACGESNVCIESRATPTLLHNEIFDGAIGILARNGAQGVISSTTIFGKLHCGISIAGEASSPTFENCFIHDIRGVGVQEEGKALLTGCRIVGCSTAVEARGESRVAECDVRDCPVGICCLAGSTLVTSTTVSTASKVGFSTAAGASPRFERARVFRCRTGMQLEGAGEVCASEVYWNYDNVVVLDGSSSITGNNFYDAQHIGLIIRDGTPTVMNNMIFDNDFASLVIEDGVPVVEDNRIFFEQQDGALIAKPDMKGALSKNTVRNVQSPNWDKGKTDRTLHYNVLGKESERNSAAFKRLAKASESNIRRILDAVLPALIPLDEVIPAEYRRRPLDDEFVFEDPDDAGSDVLDADWGNDNSGGSSSRGSSRNRHDARYSDSGPLVVPRPPSPVVSRAPARRSTVSLAPASAQPMAAKQSQPQLLTQHRGLPAPRASFKFPTDAAGPSASPPPALHPSSPLNCSGSMSATFGRAPTGLGISQAIEEDLAVLHSDVDASMWAPGGSSLRGRVRGDSLFRVPKEVVAVLSETERLVSPAQVDREYTKMRRRGRTISFMVSEPSNSARLHDGREAGVLTTITSTNTGFGARSFGGRSSRGDGGDGAPFGSPTLRKRAVGFGDVTLGDASSAPVVDLSVPQIAGVAKALIACIDAHLEQASHPRPPSASGDAASLDRSKSNVAGNNGSASAVGAPGAGRLADRTRSTLGMSQSFARRPSSTAGSPPGGRLEADGQAGSSGKRSTRSKSIASEGEPSNVGTRRKSHAASKTRASDRRKSKVT